MTELQCVKCNTINSTEYFQKRPSNISGYSGKCKKCLSEEKREWHIQNKEKVYAKQKIYKLENKEKIALQKKEHRKNNLERYRENKRRYTKERALVDPLYKLKENLRRRTRKAFRVSKWNKDNTTGEILGCTYEELFTHIENQFTEGMNWENQGEWHIDHIKPLSLAESEEELKSLCHYTNLQPLWALDNIKKGNSF